MVDVQHGFYIFVQLQVAPGADAVIAEEATNSIVGHGRFLHIVSSPGILVVHSVAESHYAAYSTL